MPREVYLGTSSWSYTGWAGSIYLREYPESRLARDGLAAYATHPLMGAVGLDRGFYAPVPLEALQRYAARVPPSFRFIAKAYAGLTTSPDKPPPAYLQSAPAVYLDAEYATRHVIEPLRHGLGERLGALVFQFSPQGAVRVRQPRRFRAALHEFLRQLPRGPQYAVELRDRAFLGSEYDALLVDVGAVHCASSHPTMPPVDQQSAATAGPLLVRWLLHHTQTYESARERYWPYSAIVDADPVSRERVGRIVLAALAAERQAYVIASNKAEGAAPQTVVELARWIAEHAPAHAARGA